MSTKDLYLITQVNGRLYLYNSLCNPQAEIWDVPLRHGTTSSLIVVLGSTGSTRPTSPLIAARA